MNSIMDQITLGQSGLRASRMGLGGGGHSQLGKRTGRPEHESVEIVRRALMLGINFIDTAEVYGTEEIVGQGIRGTPRDQVIVSTKKSMWGDRPTTPAGLRAGIEQSLRRLGTDYVDIYHLHGLKLHQYDHALSTLVPEMCKLKAEGKLRAIGVTEAFDSDRGHAMLQRAMTDDCWDIIMVGFNILNQSARDRVLRAAREKNIGVLGMFAVRAALSQPAKLKQTIQELLDSGQLDRSLVDDPNDPLGFLKREGVAPTVTEAAYRFARDEPGMHVVLSGTGNLAHLEENVASIQQPPLPAAIRQRLIRMFDGIDNVSGQ
jgi:aryl-alcohol dehydrogenase-like predicted oxidoreductase